MSAFFHQIIDYRSILLLFVFGVCLVGYGVPAFRETGHGRYYGLFWLVLGLLAIIGWCLFMFGG